MLKAAIEKILSLDEPHIKSIEGRTYGLLHHEFAV